MSDHPRAYDERGRPVDRLDRVQPHRMNAVTFRFALGPDYLRQFRGEVPGEMFTLDKGEEGALVAVIACQCGGEPQAQPGYPTGCDGCERVFLYDGDRVRVAYADEWPSTDLVRSSN